MADRKWYATVKGGGSYGTTGGRRISGGPVEITEAEAREIASGGFDGIIVGTKPVSLTESALRGPLTLEDIFPAAREAEDAQNAAKEEEARKTANAELLKLEGGEPAPLTPEPDPVDEREPLPSNEDEVRAKLAGDDAEPAADEAPPEFTCPHEDCDKHGYAYASADSLQRHLDKQHGEGS